MYLEHSFFNFKEINKIFLKNLFLIRTKDKYPTMQLNLDKLARHFKTFYL